MLIKQHKAGERLILAICDEAIIGKKYAEKGLRLDLTDEFYQGQLCTEKEALLMCKSANIINAVGKDTVAFLLKCGFCRREDIRKVKDIPHIQVLLE